MAPLPFKTETGLAADGPAIHRFSLGPEVRTGSVSLRDYDFTRPNLLLSPQSVAQQDKPVQMNKV